MAAQRTALDPRRWHFSHGPIDIVAEADGDPAVVAQAHDDAWRRFERVLDELVSELPSLRLPVDGRCMLRGPIARRMWHACSTMGADFITPMAAVAGSVAQELVACYERPGIERAWLNNGGDIALHLAAGQSVRVGVFADLARFDVRRAHEAAALATDGQFTVRADMPVRGVATSGWRGRSFSLGIADSVTVLAATAAQADAAATVIANAVDVDDAAIERLPAHVCKDDSDLGDHLVTVDVGTLAPAQVRRALDAGVACARRLQREGRVWAAALVCQQQWRLVEAPGAQAMQLDAAAATAWPSIPSSARPAPAGRAVGSVFA